MREGEIIQMKYLECFNYDYVLQKENWNGTETSRKIEGKRQVIHFLKQFNDISCMQLSLCT